MVEMSARLPAEKPIRADNVEGPGVDVQRQDLRVQRPLQGLVNSCVRHLAEMA